MTVLGSSGRLVATIVILVAGCGDDSSPSPGPTVMDLGFADTGGQLDASVEPDAAVAPDAGFEDASVEDAGQMGCSPPCTGDTPICDPQTNTCVACLQQSDCDDSDTCTNEACDQGSCVYSYAGGASCQPAWRNLNVTSPPSVGWAAAAYDPVADVVIMFGGIGGNGVSGETWSWDGSEWTQLSPTTSPSARFTHGMAYSPFLGRIVLFGGLDRQFAETGLSDTWQWNGTNWIEMMPTQSPPGRGVHRNMAYDPSSGDIVLFGGGQQPSVPTLGDAWVYDGITWTPIAPDPLPSARVAACMGTDTSMSRVLMYGGGQWQNPYEGDTWSIASGVFARFSPSTSPPPLQSANCAYDSWRDRFVVQGGGTMQVPLTFTDATWEFDGAEWSQVPLPSNPAEGCCAIMTTNPGGRGLMLYNGAATWVLQPPVVP